MLEELGLQLGRLTRRAIASGDVRHYGGFVLAGLAALATDASVLVILTWGAGQSPLLARPIGIMLAMLVSWSINRTVTFSAKAPPSFREFGKFAAVSWTSQAVNYAIFAGVLLSWPETAPLVALILACFVSMFVSYAGFRFGVFEDRGR
jgi:putative flippase GtrA